VPNPLVLHNPHVSTNETFDLAGPAGRLEAILMLPDGAPQAAAVVCHAHPLQGGVMHFKVVFRVAKALQAENVAALRFNFRGVGRSEGRHDDGRGEQDDVRAGLDDLARRFPGLPLLAAGFSFGSVMALRAGCADARVRALVALGFPMAMVKDPSFLEACTRPRLFVQGANDPFGPGPVLRDLVAKLPEPRQAVVVPEADHFFSGHLDEMQEAVRAWVATRPWETR
jgi:alpha/beta superfamily hydrolase